MDFLYDNRLVELILVFHCETLVGADFRMGGLFQNNLRLFCRLCRCHGEREHRHKHYEDGDFGFHRNRWLGVILEDSQGRRTDIGHRSLCHRRLWV